MAEHYRIKHPGVVMPADLQELVQLRAHEKEYTLQFINKKEVRTKLPTALTQAVSARRANTERDQKGSPHLKWAEAVQSAVCVCGTPA